VQLGAIYLVDKFLVAAQGTRFVELLDMVPSSFCTTLAQCQYWKLSICL